MKRLILICIAIAAWLSGPSVSNGQPAPKEILAELVSRRDALENAVFETLWEELYDGVLTSWEDQRFTWDHLGRRRVAYENGPYNKDGTRGKHLKEAETSDTVFDGELVAYQQYFPNRDRVGKELNSPSPAAGYRTAIIADAEAPLRRDLQSHRNAMEYLRDTVIRELDRADRDHRIVGVTPSGTDGKAYKVEWREPTDSDMSWRRSIAEIVPARDWTISSLQSLTDDGRVVRTIDYEYSQQPNGLWAPSKGSHKHWGNKPPTANPAYEWRFTIKQCRLNDPKFNDSAFALRLADDTAVSDTRYKVSYRVGNNGALKDDLANLADKARNEANVTPGGEQGASELAMALGRSERPNHRIRTRIPDLQLSRRS